MQNKNPSHRNIASLAISVLREKGTNEKLLTELSQDQGFQRFCNEWLAQRCQNERKTALQSDLDNLAVLKDQNKSQHPVISVKKLEKLRLFEKRINFRDSTLLSTMIREKKVQIYGGYSFEETQRELVVDKTDKYAIKFCKSLRKETFPAFENVNLTLPVKSSRAVKKFLTDSFPSHTKVIYLDNCRVRIGTKQSKVSRYFPELIRTLPKVTEKIYLNQFDISTEQLRTIFSSSRKTPFLEFNTCRLHIETIPDLTRPLSQCRIQTLSFDYCGHPRFSNWQDNQIEFENLVSALSQSSDLKKSLKDISFLDSCVPKKEFERIIEKYGINLMAVSPHLELP
ncbi:unnamed protein product [Moneuplotes crassus]|uniref:Uncharacterized protein n=1 Tax=Euplotes crassus TaxID=5936 RepID=A0AAD2CZE3_EUPCR|nr:unnamed protein product [Moneuplotes crassus]